MEKYNILVHFISFQSSLQLFLEDLENLSYKYDIEKPLTVILIFFLYCCLEIARAEYTALF